MVLLAAIPRLEIARKALLAWRRPSFDECMEGLMQYRRRLQAAVVLNVLDPGRFRKAAAGEVEESQYVYGDDPIIDACLRAIDEVAPLDMDAMGMRCEDSLPDELYPACCGYPMGWDEWEEMVENLDTTNADIALYVFTTAMRLGDGDVLFKAAEHFSWNDLVVEDWPEIPDPEWERLDDLLDQRGLGVFKNAINACLYSTNNPYFDYNPWDENNLYDLPPFSVEGVRALETAWEEAQQVREDLTKASIQFARDLSLARTLYELYVESAEEAHPQPQTLSEIWAGEADDGEPVIDEFYGPIGLEA